MTLDRWTLGIIYIEEYRGVTRTPKFKLIRSSYINNIYNRAIFKSERTQKCQNKYKNKKLKIQKWIPFRILSVLFFQYIKNYLVLNAHTRESESWSQRRFLSQRAFRRPYSGKMQSEKWFLFAFVTRYLLKNYANAMMYTSEMFSLKSCSDKRSTLYDCEYIYYFCYSMNGFYSFRESCDKRINLLLP